MQSWCGSSRPELQLRWMRSFPHSPRHIRSVLCSIACMYGVKPRRFSFVPQNDQNVLSWTSIYMLQRCFCYTASTRVRGRYLTWLTLSACSHWPICRRIIFVCRHRKHRQTVARPMFCRADLSGRFVSRQSRQCKQRIMRWLQLD